MSRPHWSLNLLQQKWSTTQPFARPEKPQNVYERVSQYFGSKNQIPVFCLMTSRGRLLWRYWASCSADHWAQWTISWWVYGLNRCFSNWLNQIFKFILEVKVLLRVKKEDETGAILISLLLSWVNVKVTCRSGSNLLSFWWPTGGDSCGCTDVDEKKPEALWVTHHEPMSMQFYSQMHALLVTSD